MDALKKGNKKSKTSTAQASTSNDSNVQPMKPFNFQPKTIFELVTLDRILCILFGYFLQIFTK